MLSPHNRLCFEQQEEKSSLPILWSPNQRQCPPVSIGMLQREALLLRVVGKSCSPNQRLGMFQNPRDLLGNLWRNCGRRDCGRRKVLHPLRGAHPDLARQAINALVDVRMMWLGDQKNHLEQSWGWKGKLRAEIERRLGGHVACAPPKFFSDSATLRLLQDHPLMSGARVLSWFQVPLPPCHAFCWESIIDLACGNIKDEL